MLRFLSVRQHPAVAREQPPSIDKLWRKKLGKYLIVRECEHIGNVVELSQLSREFQTRLIFLQYRHTSACREAIRQNTKGTCKARSIEEAN